MGGGSESDVWPLNLGICRFNVGGDVLKELKVAEYAASFYSDWFSLNKRRTRASFAASIFLGSAFVAALVAISKYLFAFQSGIFVVTFSLMWWAAYGCLACQRLLDIGAPRWWSLPFMLVQFFYVLFPYGGFISVASVAVLIVWPTKQEDLVSG